MQKQQQTACEIQLRTLLTMDLRGKMVQPHGQASLCRPLGLR